MAQIDPKQNLTIFLTNNDDEIVDTASDFETPEAVDNQIYMRLCSEAPGGYGLPYFTAKANQTALILRAYRRKSREEAVMGLLQNMDLARMFVGAGKDTYLKIGSGEKNE